MKTLKLEVQIGNNLNGQIKQNLKKRIDDFQIAKAKAKQELSEALKGMFKFREELLQQLNEEVGEDVWYIDQRNGENSYGKGFKEFKSGGRPYGAIVSLNFKDGIRRNTSYPDYELFLFLELGRKQLGELEYLKILSEPRLALRSYYHNGSTAKDITDLSEVHAELDKHYLTYFTK